MTMELREPDAALRATFLKMADAFRAAGEARHRETCSMDETAFAKYVQRLQARGRGEALERGTVTEQTFWLLDGETIGGVSRLRPKLDPFHERLTGHIGFEIAPTHRLGDAGKTLLLLTLEKARAAGITRVLLCCDPEKAERRRIVEAAGGTLLDEVSGVLPEGDAYRKVRYVVSLP